MLRLTIGTADFTDKQFYTYDDMPPGQTDINLEHFSIQKDIDYHIISTVKKFKTSIRTLSFCLTLEPAGLDEDYRQYDQRPSEG